jgi:plastocyanin
MSGLVFTVTEISVPVGDVTFVNKDGVGHLLAEGDNGTEAASPRIQQTAIAANAQGVITFSAASDYHVTCLIHHTMNMVVHVH